MGELGRKFLHKLPDMEILRNLESPFILWIQIDIYFLASTRYRFTVKVGTPPDAEAAKAGTKLSRGANFRCLMSGTPVAGDYIKSEGKAGRISARLMAIVAEGDRRRVG